MRALGFFLLALLAAAPLRAEEIEKPTLQLLDSVVRVRAEVPREARTAASLATERVGSGVVFYVDGLVVTIGFLIM
jgi:hypothetical protein